MKKVTLLLNKGNKFINTQEGFPFFIWFRAFLLIFSTKKHYCKKFSEKITGIIGNGNSLVYASGRMAFYHLLCSFNLHNDDEVILQVPNCAVMFNAVIRSGAKPIAVDLDNATLGSSILNIEKKVTKNTKVIVVQHTLGIPCKIDLIATFCKNNNIILIEDCALTMSSKFNNIIVGNFGDYAIFSFDNTKPINSICGGLLYSTNFSSLNNLKIDHTNLLELSRSFNFFILVNAFLNNYLSKRFNFLYNLIYITIIKLCHFSKYKYRYPFLYNDNDIVLDNTSSPYPYPAIYSECFAFLGLYSTRNWDTIKMTRVNNFNKLLEIIEKYNIGKVPDAYYSTNLNIIPLRFVVLIPPNSIYYTLFNNSYNRNYMWFISPIALNNYKKFNISDNDIPNCLNFNEKCINIPLDNSYEVERVILKIKLMNE